VVYELNEFLIPFAVLCHQTYSLLCGTGGALAPPTLFKHRTPSV